MNATETTSRKTIRAKKPAVIVAEPAPVIEPPAAPEEAVPGWTAWPTSASLGFEPVNLPKYFGPKAKNSAGVAASWTNSATRLARIQKNGVRVTYNGETSEHRSVAEAFRHFRLDFSKHIRFRGILKQSKKEAFTNAKGEVFMFTLVESEAEGSGEKESQ